MLQLIKDFILNLKLAEKSHKQTNKQSNKKKSSLTTLAQNLVAGAW